MQFKLNLVSFFLLLCNLAGAHHGYHHGHDHDHSYGNMNRHTCNWITGQDLKNTVPQLQSTLDRLAALDWYYAADLDYEIEALNYCETEFYHKTKVTYRVDDVIFINKKVFDKIETQNKPTYILREVLKSYLAGPNFEQNSSSMAKTLQNVENGTLNNLADLHFQMKQNKINFPFTVMRLANFKNELVFTFKGPLKQIEILKSANELEGIKSKLKLLPQDLLTPFHVSLIKKILNPTFTFEKMVFIACSDTNVTANDIQSIFTKPFSRPIVIGQCFEALKKNPNPNIENELLGTIDVVNSQLPIYWNDLFDFLRRQNFTIVNDVVTVEGGVVELSGTDTSNKIALKYLEPLNDQMWNNKFLIRFFGEALIKLHKLENSNVKIETLFGSEMFHSAFDIKPLEDWILSQSISDKEKQIALTNLKLVYQYFWDRTVYDIWSKQNEDLAKKVRSLINSQNLGYEI